MTTTPNLGLYKPSVGETGWGGDDKVDGNWDTLDASIARLGINIQDPPYSAPGDGSDQTDIFQQALSDLAAWPGGELFVPPGSYLIADGETLSIPNRVRIRGFHGESPVFSVKNSYAFSFNPDALENGFGSGSTLEDVNISMRSGATSGGAVQSRNVNAMNLRNITYSGQQSITTDPAFDLGGMIGCRLYGLVGGNQPCGIYTNGYGKFNNLNTYEKCRFRNQGSETGYSLKVAGGTGHHIRDFDAESCDGYSIVLSGCGASSLTGGWFEANANTHLLMDGCTNCLVYSNSFFYQTNTVETAYFIELTGTAGGRHTNTIMANNFQDGSTAGPHVKVGAGVEFTNILFNKCGGPGGLIGPSGGFDDEGSWTFIMGNDSGTTQAPALQFPSSSAVSQMPGIYADHAPAPSGTPYGDECLFAVSDQALENYFTVGSRGIPVFRTKTDPSGYGGEELPSYGFLLYFDPADNAIKARVRDETGALFTQVLTNP